MGWRFNTKLVILQFLFYRNNIIEDLEADLTGAPEETSNAYNLALSEVANAHEAITAEAEAGNDMKNILIEEQKKESYKETMNIYFENITTIEKRNKVYTKLSNTIYEVIQQDFVDETDIFTDNFIKHCKNNVNEDHNIPLGVKNSLKRMSMEQGLYAQVVMLRQKDLKITEANKIKIEINLSSKVSLQYHSVGMILVLVLLKKLLSHVNQFSIGKYFKGVIIQKKQIHLKCLKF